MSFFSEIVATIKACSQNQYPEYVLSRKAQVSGVPVFAYHRVRKEDMEMQLQHLLKNHYVTYNCEQLYIYLKNGNESSVQPVVLTFDDGYEDIYELVYPLLRKHDFQIVVYIVPAWIGKAGMLNWEQIIELHESGLVDFQSHTANHQTVFIDDTIVNYFSSEDDPENDYNFPYLKDVVADSVPLGYPLFHQGSRCSDHLRFYPDHAFVNRITDYVKENGGSRFFKQKNWRKKLDAYTDTLKEFDARGSYETEENQQEAIKNELSDSVVDIKKHLKDKAIDHFAFPWFIEGRTTRKILKELNFKTAVIGLANDKNSNEAGSDPYRVVRINGDFVMSLPGRGRRSIVFIFMLKIFRRITWGVSA